MKKIEWTYRAKNKLEQTYNFWLEHNLSVTYSEKVLDETLKAVNLIAKNPEIGREDKNLRLRRFLLLEYFSQVYRVEKDKIRIVSFFDNRRRPQSKEL